MTSPRRPRLPSASAALRASGGREVPINAVPAGPTQAEVDAPTCALDPDERHLLGRRGEDLAARFLASRGFAIIERNWRPASDASASTLGARIKLRGELDAIAWDGEPLGGGTLCFVEVKSRSSGEWGTPGQAVDASKQRQIVRLAQAFLALRGENEPRLWDAPCRFDVVEVWLAEGQMPRIALHKAAFDASPTSRPREF